MKNGFGLAESGGLKWSLSIVIKGWYPMIRDLLKMQMVLVKKISARGVGQAMGCGSTRKQHIITGSSRNDRRSKKNIKNPKHVANANLVAWHQNTKTHTIYKEFGNVDTERSTVPSLPGCMAQFMAGKWWYVKSFFRSTAQVVFVNANKMNTNICQLFECVCVVLKPLNWLKRVVIKKIKMQVLQRVDFSVEASFLVDWIQQPAKDMTGNTFCIMRPSNVGLKS